MRPYQEEINNKRTHILDVVYRIDSLFGPLMAVDEHQYILTPDRNAPPGLYFDFCLKTVMKGPAMNRPVSTMTLRRREHACKGGVLGNPGARAANA